MDALSSEAIAIITEFTPQGISNTSWAFAKLAFEAWPLIHSLAAESLARKSEFAVQNLASIAWSFASINLKHQPFMESLASAARRISDASGVQGFGGPNIQSLLWSLWRMKRSDLAQAVCRSWLSGSRVPCVLEMGLLIMEGAWKKDHRAEPELLVRLMQSMPVRLMRIALWRIAMVPAGVLPAEAPGLPPCDALGLSEQECRRYMKLARFVQHLESGGHGGSPEDVIEAVERFPKTSGRWLKVAGGDKAVVLWDALRSRPNAAHEVAVEFGALVGYTTIRLGAVCARVVRHDPARARAGCTNVVSIELDVCHACVARHAVDLAGLSGSVEIWVGQVRDLIPRTLEDFGALSLCYLFMDQKGTAFHEDLQQLELLGVLGVEGQVLADNCLKPGAPFFVWRAATSLVLNTTIWAMPEFASEEIEDWMVVCRYTARPDGLPPECPPHVHRLLSQLVWETDNMRTGAERGALHVDDWVAFSQYVLRCFARLGVEARPWTGLPEPPGGHPWDMPLDNARLAERYEAALQHEGGEEEEEEAP
uniref:RNA-editing substrate-binding complex 6 protein domain-containing protein n=2 Tax=Alexandrium monilatum TaxID=311494 RepID=A0A7S4QMP1_9DINO